jgi:ferredoxin, 2Fe-2S
MTVVRIEPGGIEIEVAAREPVAEAAWRQGYTWPTKCYGQLDCTQCFARITAGEEQVLPALDDELFTMRTRLPARLRSPLVRLGCRVLVAGDGVVLEKKGVRPPPSSLPVHLPPIACGHGEQR